MSGETNVTSKANRRRWVWLCLAIVGTLAVIAVLATLLVPGLRSVLAGEQSQGSQAFDIATEARVTPDAGWVVQPAAGESLRLYSPDRELRVVLMPRTGQHTERLLEAETSNHPGAAAVTEILANGAELTHVDSADRIVGELRIDGVTVLFDAVIDRPSSDLGVSGAGSRVDEPSIDVYRTTLAELLLQIEAI